MKVLLVEDDQRISDFVIKGLSETGYSVSLAITGAQARELINQYQWDIILMDIMLPDLDGVEITKLVRFKKNKTPIMIISALSDTDDKIAALDSGADDYLSKPFQFGELLSRMKALVRRSKFDFEAPSNLYSIKNIKVNPDEHTVRRGEELIDLSATEFKLLVYLLQNKNKVLSRTNILNAVWGFNFDNHTNLVDVYISYLRNKLDQDKEHSLIKTIKGVGYTIKAEE